MTIEEAVNCIKDLKNSFSIYADDKDIKELFEALDLAIKALEQIRPKGKWIEVEDAYGMSWFRCDKCGDFEYVNSDYCPLCGADMRGEAE